MKQSRIMSMVEATANVVVGYVLAIATQIVVFPWFGIETGLAEHLTFVEANAEELPFDDNSFDAYTIAFGIRNVPRIDVALSEAYRVLKQAGLC